MNKLTTLAQQLPHRRYQIALKTAMQTHRTPQNAADVDANERLRSLLRERSSVRGFADEPVPEEILADILLLTQRAPTAFNVQPYVMVVVRDQEERDQLADNCMLATNGRKVKGAPVVVAFAADLEPSHLVPRIQELKRNDGVPDSVVNDLPLHVRLFSGDGFLMGPARAALSTFVSPHKPVPANIPTMAWAYKQTTFAASAFMYAAQSYGLGTLPMEGFDEKRVRKTLGIPSRYSVPVMICCGYRKPEEEQSGHGLTSRLGTEEQIFMGKFGQSSAQLFKKAE